MSAGKIGAVRQILSAGAPRRYDQPLSAPHQPARYRQSALLMTVRPLSVLTFTTLFPNAARPSHGIFVANRLEQLVASGAVDSHVIAPVPWRPASFDHASLGRLDRIPLRSTFHGLTVEHPRYPLIPKVGMGLAPWALYH